MKIKKQITHENLVYAKKKLQILLKQKKKKKIISAIILYQFEIHNRIIL